MGERAEKKGQGRAKEGTQAGRRERRQEREGGRRDGEERNGQALKTHTYK